MRTRRNYAETQEAGNFEPIPDGVYRLAVVKVTEQETQKGDPMAAIQLRVTQGLHENRRVFHNVVFHEPGSPGAGFTKHWLRIMEQGFEGEVTYDTDDWERREIVARIGIETYKDKSKNVIESCWHLCDNDVPELGIGEDTSESQPKNDKEVPQNNKREDLEEVPF